MGDLRQEHGHAGLEQAVWDGCTDSAVEILATETAVHGEGPGGGEEDQGWGCVKARRLEDAERSGSVKLTSGRCRRKQIRKEGLPGTGYSVRLL